MKIFRFAFPLLAAFMLSGCTGYQFGSSLPESIQSVGLTVINRTDEPSVEVAVMKALLAEFQMDGRLQVVPAEEADMVLTVTLTGFRLSALAYDTRRGALAREYRLVLGGRAVLTEGIDRSLAALEADDGSGRSEAEVLLEMPGFTGESEFPYAADLTTAKLDAMPSAAADLARKVVSMVVSMW